MRNWVVLTVGSVAAVFSFATTVLAQDSTNRVDAKTDWSVFVEDNPTECWIVSAPKSAVNTRDDKVVAVNRGNILLFVSFRPGADVLGELSFTGGYPFNEGTTVNMTIGSASFELFVDGEWAWPASADEDSKIITSLKRGAAATLTGVSSRGTKTEDTFSLLGFTAALEEAQKRCSGGQ
ncbi:MAG: invasion associated locus B family protein [Rhodobacterales bacterium]